MTGPLKFFPGPRPDRRALSLGRLATALGCCLVAVPWAVGWMFPWPRGNCGMNEGTGMTMGGLMILAVRSLRPVWRILRALNDAGERGLATVFAPREASPQADHETDPLTPGRPLTP